MQTLTAPETTDPQTQTKADPPMPEQAPVGQSPAEPEAQQAATATDPTPGVLDWKYGEEDESWNADSAVVKQGILAAFYSVYDAGDGKWSVDASSEGILPSDGVDDFDSLDAAKAWCAAREAELFTASRKPAEAEPAPALAEEKVGDGEPISDTPDADAWKAILNARHREREASERVEALTLDLKYAKKAHDAASDYLGQLIDEAQEPNLFNSKTATAAGKSTQIIPENIPSASPLPEQSSIPTDDDSWKSVTLEDLGIKTSRVLKALHEHNPPITTFGELSAWQEKKTQYWATDIKGLGDKGKEEIENAQFAYWNAHPRTASLPTDKPQEQKADGPGPLVWERNPDSGPDDWRAGNTVGIMGPTGSIAHYYAEANNNADFGIPGTRFDVATDLRILADEKEYPEALPTLEAAQQWCQQQNDAAWARLKAAKNETAMRFQYSAKDGENLQSSDPIPAASLNLSEDAIRKSYYPKLLEEAKDGRIPPIEEALTIGGEFYIAVTASLMDPADYVLTPMYGLKDDVCDAPETDRYAGILVMYDCKKFWLGSAAQSIRVSVKPSPIKLPPPDAQAASDVANTAKQTGVAAIDADKAKRSKRGKKMEPATV